MPSVTTGGQEITLRGIGFNPAPDAVIVKVGAKEAEVTKFGQDLEGPFLKFTSPAKGDGVLDVSVESDDGRLSNVLALTYPGDSENFAPVKFANVEQELGEASTAITYCFGYVFVALGNPGLKGGGGSIWQFEIGPGPDFELTEV